MLRPILPYLLCILALSTCVLAKDKPELTQFGHDIRVEPGESVADLTCINCSIYVAGESAGEATAIHGNIILEAGGSIAGDVTAVWGDVRMCRLYNVKQLRGAFQTDGGNSNLGDKDAG